MWLICVTHALAGERINLTSTAISHMLDIRSNNIVIIPHEVGKVLYCIVLYIYFPETAQ